MDEDVKTDQWPPTIAADPGAPEPRQPPNYWALIGPCYRASIIVVLCNLAVYSLVSALYDVGGFILFHYVLFIRYFGIVVYVLHVETGLATAVFWRNVRSTDMHRLVSVAIVVVTMTWLLESLQEAYLLIRFHIHFRVFNFRPSSLVWLVIGIVITYLFVELGLFIGRTTSRKQNEQISG